MYIPGIGVIAATTLLGEIGDVTGVSSPVKLIK
jgi:transposase